MKKIVPSACLLLALSVTLHAQVPQVPARLTGMVLDPAKDYVPGATITVRGRRVRRELYSANDGRYSIELPPGIYIVRIAQVGFYPVRRRVRVQSNGVTTLEVALRVRGPFAKTWIVTRPG
jgi:Carboxypeptidase regulatory-like domain